MQDWLRKITITLVLSVPFFAKQTHAQGSGLPTASPPTRGTTAGAFITNLQNYAYDIAVLAGLGLATFAFLVVVKNVTSTYSQVAEGRSTMGMVGMHSAVGALLLVFIVYLTTEALKIL